jgi:Anti-sigma-K factor rskA, C-terminal
MTRVHDLLADRALEGLDETEAAELASLGAEGDDSFDLAAAALDLATLRVEPMPAAVAERIRVAAPMKTPATLAGWSMPGRIGEAPKETPPGKIDGLRSSPIESRRRRVSVAWFAAAAGVLLAIGAWLWAGRQSPVTAVAPTEARSELLASATDVTRLAWQPMKDPAATGASGDVVWSTSAQRGYMRFVGLQANDPTKYQYQLWIFDKSRDQAFPVDGGVFDVTSTGEVIIPITAKLHVDAPVLFAVTVERPGGVVVSKRERIVVTAAPS